MDVLRKVQAYIEKEGLLQKGDRVVVGLSGGADSVCLLDLLRQLAPAWGLTLFALHVHHGIRGEEADGDRAFVEELCKAWQIPVRVICRDIPAEAKAAGLGLEEAGRLARREEFARALMELPADKIALAHHQNDLAETVLFQLARGSGLDGLTGISQANGPTIRPLLCLTRTEIEAYLASRGLSFREDSTNADTAYARNCIRRKVLPPLVSGVNARTVEHIAEAAEELREVRAYFESLLPEKWGCCAVEVSGTPSVLLRASETLAEPPLLRRLLVREAFRRLVGLKDIGKVHILAVLDLLEGGEGRRRDLPGLSAVRTYEGVHLTPAKHAEHLPKMKDPSGESPAIRGGAEGNCYKNPDETTPAAIPLQIPGETDFDGWHFWAELLSIMPDKEQTEPANIIEEKSSSPKAPLELSPHTWQQECFSMQGHCHSERSEESRKVFHKVDGILRRFAPQNDRTGGCLNNTCLSSDLGNNENHYTKCFDYGKIEKTVWVRFRRTGDYLVIHPDGRRKTLSNLLTDRKLPREERDRIPLVAAGSEVLWAVGVRGGESARVEADTRTVLRIRAERR